MKKEPLKRSDGTCSACIGGLCKYHQEQGIINDERKSQMLAEVAKNIRNYNIERLISELKLESDEGGTAWEKAERMLKKKHS